jgi:hypothetical protein
MLYPGIFPENGNHPQGEAWKIARWAKLAGGGDHQPPPPAGP